MEPYQERVVAEKRELDEKLSKLANFLFSDQDKRLVAVLEVMGDEHLRLLKQYCHMMDYSKVLGERIAAFNNARDKEERSKAEADVRKHPLETSIVESIKPPKQIDIARHIRDWVRETYPNDYPLSEGALNRMPKWTDDEVIRFVQWVDLKQEWMTWGIIEIATRNPNVDSYMKHWEARATQAENELRMIDEILLLRQMR